MYEGDEVRDALIQIFGRLCLCSHVGQEGAHRHVCRAGHRVGGLPTVTTSDALESKLPLVFRGAKRWQPPCVDGRFETLRCH